EIKPRPFLRHLSNVFGRTPKMAEAPSFLKNTEIRAKLCEIISRSTAVDLAVAYWGANGGKTLGLDVFNGSVRILCDAYSGACNPNELKSLLKRGFAVKTRTGLHSKVAITLNAVVIGSANVSANGLGQEGEEANNFEAAALINVPAFIADV